MILAEYMKKYSFAPQDLPPHELIQQYQEKRASLNSDIDRILTEIEAILVVEV